jgi:uncharacterized protein (TIGR02569 family)
MDERLLAWVAAFTHALRPDGRFRVAQPIAAHDGAWVVDGWAATTWVEGAHLSNDWDRILDVSGAFHAAAASTGIGPSEAITARSDPWAIGDRVAWGEQPPASAWPDPLAHLLDGLEPLLSSAFPPEPRQVIHGDLGGNVLFADRAELPPAVIDISPYYRPAAWADAIIVADAVTWEKAPPALAARFLAQHSSGKQLVARAIVYRVVTAAAHSADQARVVAEIEAYTPLIALLNG